MSTVELTEGYYIEIEGRDYTLKRRVTTKPVVEDGKVVKEAGVTEKFVSYHGNLEGAVKRYLQEVQNSVGERYCNSIKEYAEMVDQINTVAIEAICGLLKKGGLVVC